MVARQRRKDRERDGNFCTTKFNSEVKFGLVGVHSFDFRPFSLLGIIDDPYNNLTLILPV